MPRNVHDLLHPPPPPPPPPDEPHNTIVTALCKDMTLAYDEKEIVEMVRRLKPSFGPHEILSALHKLVESAVIAETFDGTTRRYYRRSQGSE